MNEPLEVEHFVNEVWVHFRSGDTLDLNKTEVPLARLTPDQARAIAEQLLRAANKADEEAIEWECPDCKVSLRTHADAEAPKCPNTADVMKRTDR